MSITFKNLGSIALMGVCFSSVANEVLIIDVSYQNGQYEVVGIKERVGAVFSVPRAVKVDKDTNGRDFILKAVGGGGSDVYQSLLPGNLTVHTPMPPYGDGKRVEVDNAHYQLRFPALQGGERIQRLELLGTDDTNRTSAVVVNWWDIDDFL